MKNQFILGISCYGHDSSAAIINNGDIIAAVREERFDRIKHSGNFSLNSINYCLNKAKIGIKDIHYIVYPDKPFYYLFRIFPHLIKYFPKTLNFLKHMDIYLSEISLKHYLKEKYKLNRLPAMKFILNHQAHGAGAFYLSPFDEASIFSADGVGTYNTVWMGIGYGSSIKKINNIEYPNSLGLFYSAITQFLGFRTDDEEYKVMALVALGKPSFKEQIRKMVVLKKKGKFKLDLSNFMFHTGSKVLYSKKLSKVFEIPPRNRNEKLKQIHYNIAASAQQVLEETVFWLLNQLYKKTKNKNLCISGGVGMNSVLNGKIKENTQFENIFIQPSCDDSGCTLGGALYLYNKLNHPLKKRKYTNTDYLGPGYNSKEIKEKLEGLKVNFKKIKSFRKIALELARGKIIGLFDGRMEFGPRALGSRSILADSRFKKMKDKLNKIKGREPFRPFAPVILEEFAGDYFDNFAKNHFMTMAVKVKEEKRKIIPAAIHYDGTARVQTVPRNGPLKLRKILNEFHKITGVPVLINTSFNKAGEPIVCVVEDAVNSFLKMKLDILIIGDYVIYKNRKVNL